MPTARSSIRRVDRGRDGFQHDRADETLIVAVYAFVAEFVGTQRSLSEALS